MATFGDQGRAFRLGIAPSYPRSLSDLPQVASFVDRPTHGLPGADTLVRELVTLPTHSLLTVGDVEEIRRMFDTL
jgi:dTDP-4-amino-4,6-dideoxygalactose transaminase